MQFRAIVALILASAVPVSADAPVLGLPIDCSLGETCYIQNFVDHDPGAGIKDFRCGGLTYDGHKGTDFGLPTLADMRRGVDILAAAPGMVRGFRDGAADVGATAETKGRECGNGVVLRHADGWETQYCHLKSGSIAVLNGQIVQRGDVLGQVGLSGQTEFPHVHLSVRHNGQRIDPFQVSPQAQCGESGETLWQEVPQYVDGGLLDAGFSPGVPSYADIKDGSASQSELAADAPGLVVFGFGFGSQKGDIMEMQVNGPMGAFLTQSIEIDRDQAQYFRATGKRLTKARWPAGMYLGTVVLRRDGREIDRRDLKMQVK